MEINSEMGKYKVEYIYTVYSFFFFFFFFFFLRILSILTQREENIQASAVYPKVRHFCIYTIVSFYTIYN